MKTFLVGLLLFASTLCAQPFVYYRGVVNVASVMSPGLPGGAIARGSMFSIYGRNLGPAAGVQVSTFPLNPTFSNVSIKITQGTTTVDALPVYVSAGQINAIMPSNTPLGTVSMRVTFNGTQSNASPVNIVPVSFGIFAVNGGGFGPGYVTNFLPNVVPPINSLRATLKPGQIGTVWGTGLGAAAQDNNAAAQIDLPTSVEVFIGGIAAKRLYAGRSNCCSSIDQVIFETPANVPVGCFVPVVVRVAGTVVSNTVTAAVTTTGNTCSDPTNPFVETLLNGGKTSAGILLRVRSHYESLLSVSDDTSDFAWAGFRQYLAWDWSYNPLVSLPPLGTCASFNGPGDWTLGDMPLGIGPQGQLLDAGTTLNITGAPGTVKIPRTSVQDKSFSAILASTLNIVGTALSYLTGDAAYTITGAGGPDVGPLQWSVVGPAPLTWSDPAASATVNRNTGISVHWPAITTANAEVVVAGMNVNPAINATGAFLCRVPASAGAFTVPGYVLANIPPNTNPKAPPKGLIYVGTLRNTATGTVPTGLDRLLTVLSSGDARTAVFQ